MKHWLKSTFAHGWVFVLLACALAASDRLDAQQVITPPQIDSYLSGKRIADFQKTATSPLVGQGSQFVTYGGQYTVDPRFIVAISGAESSFGVHICAANNAWNWFWNGSCVNSPFDSFASGIHTVSHFMHSSYIVRGYNTIQLVGARYCVTGCQNWVPGVTEFYGQMGADVSTLVWLPPAGEAGATTAAGNNGTQGTATATGTGAGTQTTGAPGTSTPTTGATGTPTGTSATTTPAPPPAPEQVTLQGVELAGGNKWWNAPAARPVEVSATVTGATLIPGTVALWQELAVGHKRTELALLTAATNGQPGQYVVTFPISAAGTAELYVTARFKHGKTSVRRASNSLPAPVYTPPPAWVYVLLAILAFIVVCLIVLAVVLIHRKRKRSTALPLRHAA
jgi:hypothetical protein